MLKLRVVAGATYALYAHFRKAVVYGENLILMEHEIRRIDLSVRGFAAREAALHEAERRRGEHADVSETVNAASGGAEAVDYGLGFAGCKAQTEADVAALEYERYLVDDVKP